MKKQGSYKVFIIGSDLYDFLNGYSNFENEDGTLIFLREELEEYANLDRYDKDDYPNESVLAGLQLLLKNKEVDLFILR